MRHLILGFCVLSVVSPATGAFAQNYLPARQYAGPETIVNMDVLEPGMNAYGGLPLRPPVYSDSLPAPLPAPVPSAALPDLPPLAAAAPAADFVPAMPMPVAPAMPPVASLPPVMAPAPAAPSAAPVIAAMPEPSIYDMDGVEPLPSGKTLAPVRPVQSADRLLQPSVMAAGIFPSSVAPAGASRPEQARPLQAQPLIQEVTPAARPSAPVETRSAAIAWEQAPVIANPPVSAAPAMAGRDGVLPPPVRDLGAPAILVPPVMPSDPLAVARAGTQVPRIPNADLREALVLPPPERTVLAAINDDPARASATASAVSVPSPVMAAPSSSATRAEMGINGSNSNALATVPVDGNDFRSLSELQNRVFPPVDGTASAAQMAPDGTAQMAVLAPPTAPLGAQGVTAPADRARLDRADDFEAYRLFFDATSDVLKPSEKAVLDKIIGKMQADPTIRLRMQAYAAGTPETAGQARRLSLSRAMKIRAYMMEKGIVATRLDVRALGIGSAELGDTIARSKAPADRVDVIFVRSGRA